MDFLQAVCPRGDWKAWRKRDRDVRRHQNGLARLEIHEADLRLGPRASSAAHALERGGVVSGQNRVHEGARASERDPGRGVIQLETFSRPTGPMR